MEFATFKVIFSNWYVFRDFTFSYANCSSNEILKFLKLLHEGNRMAKKWKFSIEAIRAMNYIKLVVRPICSTKKVSWAANRSINWKYSNLLSRQNGFAKTWTLTMQAAQARKLWIISSCFMKRIASRKKVFLRQDIQAMNYFELFQRPSLFRTW